MSFSQLVASNDLYSFKNTRDSVPWNILGIHVLFEIFIDNKWRLACKYVFLQENAAMRLYKISTAQGNCSASKYYLYN